MALFGSGCGDDAEGVPLAKRLFVADQTKAAEDQTNALPQALRRQRKRWGPPPLYIDGKFKGFLRYPELHPGLQAIWEKEPTGDPKGEDNVVRRFAWLDLFALHGVDPLEIKAVHFYGGRGRISVASGDEVRRVGREYRFSFNNRDGGTIRQRPPRGGVEVNTSVDIVTAIAVYVERPAPTYDDGIIVLSDGTKMSVQDERGTLLFPYSDGEQHGGSRVYLDGRYVDAFRRRALTADMVSDPKAPASPYLLAKVLKSMKIDLSKVKRITVWGDADAKIGDWSGDDLAQLEQVTFVLGQHSRGRIIISGMSEKTVMSMMIYADLTEADRTPPKADGSPGFHAENGKSNDSMNE